MKRKLARPLWLAVFGAILLLSALAASWALSHDRVLGQTIPLPTDTPTTAPTNTSAPTSTWTPHPTWTTAPTEASARSTATPSRTPTAGPTATPTGPARPTATRTGLPAALVLEVVVEPTVAGPEDEVRFTVQVANVGRDPLHDVKVSGAFSDTLELRELECVGCAPEQVPGQLPLIIGTFPSGGQVLASITFAVAADALPDQVVETEWVATAVDAEGVNVTAGVDLPWAELPATGAGGEPPAVAER